MHFNVIRFWTRDPKTPIPLGALNVLPFLPIFLSFTLFASTFPLARAEAGGPIIIDFAGEPPQCGSFTFTWSGGTPPYTLVINAEDGTAVREPLDNSNNVSYTWDPVDIRWGTPLLAMIKDSNNKSAMTSAFEVQDSQDSGCLTSNNSISSTAPSTSSVSISESTLTTATSTSTFPASSTPPNALLPQRSPSTLAPSAIAGIVVGSVVATVLIGAMLFHLGRKVEARRVGGEDGHLGQVDQESRFMPVPISTEIMQDADITSIVPTIGRPSSETSTEHCDPLSPMPCTASQKASMNGTSGQPGMGNGGPFPPTVAIVDRSNFIEERVEIIPDDRSSDVPSTPPPPYDELCQS